MKNMFHFLRIIIIVIILTLGLIPLNTAFAQGPTVVRISAPSGVNAGVQFAVNIVVEPGTAIAGMQFNLAFNPSLVTASGVTEGNLLSQGGATTYFNPGTIDNVAGTISGVAGAITTPGQTVSTNGTFATITLTADTQGGISLLTISSVVVGDINGQAVEISVVSGQISINQSQDSGGVDDGGGSGGGGGGGGGITTLLDSMTRDGMIVNEVTASDVNQKVRLIIPRGAIVKNKFGQMVSSIRITQSNENLVADWDSRVISLLYDIQPGGTTFNPSATLVFKYDDSDLPEEISENSLYEALWDPATSTWINLGGTIDPVAHTVSVSIQHLSIYTLMAHVRPASFELSELALSSKVVVPGENLALSVLVTNTGDLAGSYEVSLQVDDGIVETKTVALDGGGSETVQFSITTTVVGEHQASIGNLSAIFSVNKPTTPIAFTLRNLVVSPVETYIGDNVSVSVLVTNTGETTGTYNAVLQIDDIEVQTKKIELDGSESQEVAFDISSEVAGQHTVTIGDLKAIYVVQASPPSTIEEYINPKAEVSNFRVNPIYDVQTGKLVSTKIEYQLDGSKEQIAGTELNLKIFFKGELLEEIPLLTLNYRQSEGNSGSLDYVPSIGWRTGLYTFQAELSQGDIYMQSTEQKQFTVTPEAIAIVVSWKILGIIIGFTLVLAAIVVTIVVVRRRDMLRSY